MAISDLFRKGESLFSTTLVTSISTGTGDTITLTSASGLPTDVEITLTFDRVDANGTETPTKMERITGTISGSTLISYTRGTDGSTEQAHSAAAVVEYIFNSQDLNDMVDGILVGHSQAGAHAMDTLAEKTADTGVTVDGVLLKDSQVQLPAGPYTVATDGATVTFNLAVSRVQIVTMAGNRTLALSNAATGMTFCLILKQDATGSRTATWFAGITWAGGSAPTLTTTAAKSDAFVFVCYGSNTYFGFVAGQNI